MKKVLITGGAGFIGYHLANKLTERKDILIGIVDNLQRGRMDEEFKQLLSRPNVKFYEADLTNSQDLAKIDQEWDEIYHLAAIVGVKHCMSRPDQVLKTNLLSTINMIDFAKQNKVKRFLFSSTCENYASGFDFGVVPVPTPETVPLTIGDVKNPRLSYAGSKIVGEQMVIFNAPSHYQYKIIRYHNVYGPRMGYAHVIPEVVNRIRNKENPFRVFGANQTRAFCFVSDAVDQTILAMEAPQFDNEIVHVGNSSKELKISELIKMIAAKLSYSPNFIEETAPPGSVNRRCPDTSKIHQKAGYSPKVKVDDGVGQTVEWYWEQLAHSKAWE